MLKRDWQFCDSFLGEWNLGRVRMNMNYAGSTPIFSGIHEDKENKKIKIIPLSFVRRDASLRSLVLESLSQVSLTNVMRRLSFSFLSLLVCAYFTLTRQFGGFSTPSEDHLWVLPLFLPHDRFILFLLFLINWRVLVGQQLDGCETLFSFFFFFLFVFLSVFEVPLETFFAQYPSTMVRQEGKISGNFQQRSKFGDLAKIIRKRVARS